MFDLFGREHATARLNAVNASLVHVVLEDTQTQGRNVAVVGGEGHPPPSTAPAALSSSTSPPYATGNGTAGAEGTPAGSGASLPSASVEAQGFRGLRVYGLPGPRSVAFRGEVPALQRRLGTQEVRAGRGGARSLLPDY